MMIIQAVIEFIVYIIFDILFQGIVMGIFRAIKWIGIYALKCITLTPASLEELKVKYKDSSKPYFLGFGLVIVCIYLIIN